MRRGVFGLTFHRFTGGDPTGGFVLTISGAYGSDMSPSQG